MIACLLLVSSLAVTNLPPPYYSVYADALGGTLDRQMELLALPLRENVRGNSTYVNTRRYLLGSDNPGFIQSEDGSGLGTNGIISVEALRLQAKTTENAVEAERCEALADWLLHKDRGLSPRVNLHHQCEVALSAAKAKSHPRVFATAADFEALKKKAETDALVKAGVARALSLAEEGLGKPVSVYALQGYQLLTVSRQAVRRLVADSFAYRMTGHRKYVADAVEELRAVCAFPNWNPRHTIDTGEMMVAVSVAYDWLYDVLDAETREKVAQALDRLGLRSEEPYAGWTRLQNNWVQVVSAGKVAALVALADRLPVGVGADYLAAILESLPEAESVCGPDGVFPEGPGYWNYGMSHNAIALDMMRTAFGTDFGLSNVKGFRETALYPAMMTGPSGLWFNYSDSHGSKGSCPAVWWFARRLGLAAAVSEMEVEDLKAFCSGEVLRDSRTFPFALFWIGDDLVAARAPLPDTWIGRGAQPVAVLSGDRTDPFAAYVAVKGGSPSYNHGHADEGSFVLDILGERWAFDLGADDYRKIEAAIGASAYWSPEPGARRWTLTRLGTFGHNTLLIGGKGQDPRGFATLRRALDTKDKVTVAGVDLTSLYPAATNVYRFVRVAGRTVWIVDAVGGIDADTEVCWTMTTDAEIEFDALTPHDLKRTGTLRKKGKAVRFAAYDDRHGEWSVESAEPKDVFEGANTGFKRLLYRSKGPGRRSITLTGADQREAKVR